MGESPREPLDELTERQVLRLFAWLYLLLGIPASVMVVIHALTRGHQSPFVLVQAVTVAAVALVIVICRERADVLKPLMTWGMLVIALAGMFHFGPNFGSALVIAATMMLATYFYGPRGAAVVGGATIGGLVINAVWMAEVSWSRPPGFPVSVVGWLRIGATTVVTLTAIAGGFHAMLVAMRRSMRKEAQARQLARDAEHERERALEAYASAQRLESVGRLAGGVSHDVNNALTIVRSGAFALREGQLSEAERQEVLDDIDRAVQAAASTTRQLVAFARGLPEDGGPASPRHVITTVARGLKRMLPEDVTIVVEAEDCTPTAMSGGMLTQVLLNLALNARDACPKGGVIRMGCEEDDEQIVVWVADDGTGMDEETKAEIFAPFFTTKHDGGTGMGLPMVLAAVTQSEGDIEVDSAPGKGTTVRVRLPPARSSAIASVPPPPRSTEESVVGSRLLLVEDQRQLLRAMAREFRAAGYVVTPVASVQGAREALSSESFDILCTDGVLTDGRAHDVVRSLVNEGGEQIPVMVCSGYLPDELALEELPASISFVRKPYDAGELVAVAKRLLATRDEVREDAR